VALLNGMLHLLIQEKLIDYVDKEFHGVDSLQPLVDDLRELKVQQEKVAGYLQRLKKRIAGLNPSETKLEEIKGALTRKAVPQVNTVMEVLDKVIRRLGSKRKYLAKKVSI
jgi:hypothetical protein